MKQQRLTIISTGGTIEKTYDADHGGLRNQEHVLDVMLEHLELPSVVVARNALMNKDSLDMTDEDRLAILAAVRESVAESDAIVVVHGTDRLVETGMCLETNLGESLAIPVILTGAMRPFELRRSDALQNLTESLLAAQLLSPGVYCVMHNKALRFPGVKKDRDQMTFVQEESS